MKLVRLLLAVVAIGGMTGLAYVAQQIEAAGPDQVAAASAFVDSLTPEQKSSAPSPSTATNASTGTSCRSRTRTARRPARASPSRS